MTLRQLGFSFACAFSLVGAAAASAKSNDATVIATLGGMKEFSFLVKAIKAAGLTEALRGSGPLTLLAPTNDAFEKIDAKALDALLKNKDEIAKVLKYHVLPKKLMAKEIVALDAKTVTTLEGSDVSVKVEGTTVKVDTAKVVKADITASNGVIHEIDTVLMPKPKM